MLRLLFVFATVFTISASVSIPSKQNGRIVGGKINDISKIPHQINLRIKQCQTCPYEQICGGNIISDKIILTAAHCVNETEARYLHVVAGTNEREGHGVVIPVKKFICHEDYRKRSVSDNDIAILFLDVGLPLNDYDIKTIKMTEVRPFPNVMAKTSGWGQISEYGPKSDLLREVEVPLLSNEVCASWFSMANLTITENIICAGFPEGGKDACTGDSGGPLSVNGTLVGVVSSGVGCARPKLPGLYVSVADLRPWIDATIQANSS